MRRGSYKAAAQRLHLHLGLKARRSVSFRGLPHANSHNAGERHQQQLIYQQHYNYYRTSQ